MLTLDKVYHANYALKEAIRQTDLIYSPVLSKECGCELYLKTENLQVTGSFKVRGAYYKISQLGGQPRAGSCACFQKIRHKIYYLYARRRAAIQSGSNKELRCGSRACARGIRRRAQPRGRA